jgi:hypothetical protein
MGAQVVAGPSNSVVIDKQGMYWMSGKVCLRFSYLTMTHPFHPFLPLLFDARILITFDSTVEKQW